MKLAPGNLRRAWWIIAGETSKPIVRTSSWASARAMWPGPQPRSLDILTTPEKSLVLTMPSYESPPDAHPNVTFTGLQDPD